jgi:hypothetical protein
MEKDIVELGRWTKLVMGREVLTKKMISRFEESHTEWATLVQGIVFQAKEITNANVPRQECSWNGKRSIQEAGITGAQWEGGKQEREWWGGGEDGQNLHSLGYYMRTSAFALGDIGSTAESKPKSHAVITFTFK